MKSAITFALFFLSTAHPAFVHPKFEGPNIPAPPPPGQYVLDTLEWLSDEQEQSINLQSLMLEAKAQAVIYVVTVNNCGSNKTSFRKELFTSWAIGYPKESGFLILVCWYDGDESRRSVEQEYGTGLNKILNSSITNQIAKEHFIPRFEDGNPGDGLVAMVDQYVLIISSPKTNDESKPPNFLFILILVMGVVYLVSLYNDRFGIKSKRRDDYRDFHDSGGNSNSGGGSSTRF